ncbi:YbjQ family protein [Baileyella intestinalis]|uniref:YbjQ family protein n=1 Tax=Baileyella intestinalis TaxID=2606709 RepID=UPI0022DEF161|nr:YbjQ family protein [Baileyella intestinalis]
MMIVSTDNIPGREIEALGMVKGSTIQTVNMFKDIGSGFKTIVGGELKNYNKMMDDARDIATKRMVQQAEEMGADAVVAVRFATSAIMQSAAEIMVYGTAVKVK